MVDEKKVIAIGTLKGTKQPPTPTTTQKSDPKLLNGVNKADYRK